MNDTYACASCGETYPKGWSVVTTDIDDILARIRRGDADDVPLLSINDARRLVALASGSSTDAAFPFVEVRTTACHAGSDGECSWAECPQTRDAEPMATGRHCPLDAIPTEAWAPSRAASGVAQAMPLTPGTDVGP